MIRSPRLALIGLALALVAARPLAAGVSVAGSRVEYAFGQQLTFLLDASADAAITGVTLFFRPAGADRTTVAEATFTPGTSVSARVVHRLSERPIAPFARVEYWWQITTQAGERITTPPQTFDYDDNRFTWQSLERDGVQVHWYDGDAAFGQAALDTTLRAAGRLGAELGAAVPADLRVYVYADAEALKAGLRLGGREWVGGHADPALGVVLVSARSGLESPLELEREIPHELTHVLLFRALGAAGYANLPNWLNEGLAVVAEGEPDPAFRVALDGAAAANTLLPLDSLCGAFPIDAEQAVLAYAQSESLVRYIRDEFGDSGTRALLAAYADGGSCSAGVQRSLGRSLAELQQDWLSDGARVNPWKGLLRALAPYAVVLALAAAPWLGLLPAFRKRRK